jgi:hypothetical protein
MSAFLVWPIASQSADEDDMAYDVDLREAVTGSMILSSLMVMLLRTTRSSACVPGTPGLKETRRGKCSPSPSGQQAGRRRIPTSIVSSIAKHHHGVAICMLSSSNHIPHRTRHSAALSTFTFQAFAA